MAATAATSTAAAADFHQHQQDNNSSSSSSYYQHEDRILVSPSDFVQETTTTNCLDLQVVLHERQILRQRQRRDDDDDDGSSSSSSNMHILSPFPAVWMKLVQQFGNLQKLTLQVASTASSTHYPMTSSFAGSTATLGVVPNGPAGVCVTADFVVSTTAAATTTTTTTDDDDDDDDDVDQQRFIALLHALQYHRLFLASLSSSHIARLHRFVRRQELLFGRRSSSSSNNNTTSTTSNNNNNTHSRVIVRYSLILPTDGGAALSAEGFHAWMIMMQKQGSKNNINNGGGGGLFSSMTNPLTWSQWMLGVLNNESGNNAKKNSQATRRRGIVLGKQRRGLWIDLESSCFFLNNEKDNNNDDTCTLQLTRGMYYTSRIPYHSSSSSSSLDMTLQDILPPGSSQKGLSRLPWAQTPTSVDIILPEYLRNTVEYRLDPDACLHQGGINTTTHTRSTTNVNNNNNVCKLAQTTTPLDQRLFQLTTRSSQEDLLTTKRHRRRPHYWSVNLNVLRPHGLSNRGTFQTTLLNHHHHDDDEHCNTTTTTTVQVFQRIPEYVTPLWRTLSIQLRQKLPTSSNTTLSSSSSAFVEKYLAWTDLDQHDIVFQPTGAVDLSFRINNFPKHSQLTLSVDYDPTFLYTLEQFAGDPNRGLEVPPVSAIFSCRFGDSNNNNNNTLTVVELTSDTVLLLPPLPDLSMPFNVLSLICTLYVFVVGSLLNLLIRRASQAVQYEYDPDSKPKSKLVVLKEKLQSVVHRILRRGRQQPQPQKQEVDTDKPKED